MTKLLHTLAIGSTALLFAVGLAAAPVPTGVRTDEAHIRKLIEQLGADNFRLREAAGRELSTIGEPALKLLDAATAGKDPEIATRAKDLVQEIRRRVERTKLLAPTLVELNLTDVPISAAVAELAKQSGIAITVRGDTTRLGNRKITIATGRVPFWTALDLLCEKADLVEIEPGNGAAVPPPVLGIEVQPPPAPIQIQRLPAMPLRPVVPLVPAPPKKPIEKPAEKPIQKPVPVPMNAAFFQQPLPVPPPQVPIPPVQPPQIKIAPMQPGGQLLLQNAPVGRVGMMGNNGPILLEEGKFQRRPTHVEGAIRIRGDWQPDKDYHAYILSVRAEPKIAALGVQAVTITKAVDDRNQDLAVVTEDPQPLPQPLLQPLPPNVPLPAPRVGRPQIGPMTTPNLVRLRKGEKKADVVRELAGIVTLQMMVPSLMATIDDVTKKQEASGENEVSLKINELTKTDTGYNAVIEVRHPSAVIPLDKPATVVNGRIERTSFRGLQLLSADGKPYKITATPRSAVRVANNQLTYTMTIVFAQADEEQTEPKSLTFTAQRQVTTEVPFVLRDLPTR